LKADSSLAVTEVTNFKNTDGSELDYLEGSDTTSVTLEALILSLFRNSVLKKLQAYDGASANSGDEISSTRDMDPKEPAFSRWIHQSMDLE
jgi:hypothetical protein